MLTDEVNTEGEMKNNLYVFTKPHRTLSSIIAKLATSVDAQTETMTVCIFSCRSYYSSNTDAIISNRRLKMKHDIFTKTHSAFKTESYIAEYTKDAAAFKYQTDTLSNLDNHYKNYFNQNIRIEDFKGLKRVNLYTNPAGIIKSLYAVTDSKVKHKLNEIKSAPINNRKDHLSMIHGLWSQYETNNFPTFIPQLDCNLK